MADPRIRKRDRPRKRALDLVPRGPHAEPVGAAAAAEEPSVLEGFVECYGRQYAAAAVIFCGWVSRPCMLLDEWAVTATFERGSVSASAQVVFHERNGTGGVGFIALLPAGQNRLGSLLRFELRQYTPAIALTVATKSLEMSDQSIIEYLVPILANTVNSSHAKIMSARLARRFVGEAYVDRYGYYSSSGGWFVNGWVSNDWIRNVNDVVEASAYFEDGQCSGVAVLNFFDRPDLGDKGLGVVLYLPSTEDALGRLLTLTLVAGEAVVSMRPAQTIERIPAETLAGRFLDLIINSDPTPSRAKLRDLISRVAFDGQDTIAELRDQVLIGIDETIRCDEDSVILIGWLLATHGTVKEMRLRSGGHILTIDTNICLLWCERPDVVDGVGREYGFEDRRCGFVIRVPITHPITDDPYLEIETQRGDIGFKRLPRPKLEGIAAIKRILACAETQYADVNAIYDHVLGPAIGALNAGRLRRPPRVQTMQLGLPIQSPRYSIIVPIFGRIDFTELQIALFATYQIGRDAEIIYVLDDPTRTRDMQFLAASLHERFRVSFKLLCLSHNMGFAPANAIGVQASSGDYICFMNSDVFPNDADWLDRLSRHLEADRTLGVVGPALLFEDDSIQHQGISFKSLPRFGNWAFPQHKRKGLRAPVNGGLVREVAITGACMLMRRKDVLAYGAFDDVFIIGDFEDTDLCFRLREHGMGSAVDLDVSMYHLERKSQAGSEMLWRSNLTLYNAWIHQRRWAGTIQCLEKAT
jgi:GT2 family glycosyltransferase